MYSAKCSACKRIFGKNDFVMRAKTKMFHLDCFRCAACTRHLGKLQPCFTAASLTSHFFFSVSGDEFALHGDGIYCKEDYELLERCEDNNNLDPKHHRIKTELDDFRDIDSDLGREDDSYR